MTQNQSIPINTISPTLSPKAACWPWERTPRSLLGWSEWWWNLEVLSVREKRRRGGAGPRETRSPKLNLHEGGNDYEGGGERRSSERVQGEHTREQKERERGECLRLQRIKNCAISKRASPAQIKLVSGHEGLAPWHHIIAWPNPHHHISRPQRSREMPACIFWGEDWNNFARWCLCHIISSYIGFITQLRRHFTVCDSNVLMYDMMKVLADRALRRSFTARGERNYAVAYLACIFNMRTCEKKPPPSLTLRGLAGKDRHFLDFMHHVYTVYGLSILRLLYCNSRLCCQCVTRCEMQWNVSGVG